MRQRQFRAMAIKAQSFEHSALQFSAHVFLEVLLELRVVIAIIISMLLCLVADRVWHTSSHAVASCVVQVADLGPDWGLGFRV